MGARQATPGRRVRVRETACLPACLCVHVCACKLAALPPSHPPKHPLLTHYPPPHPVQAAPRRGTTPSWTLCGATMPTRATALAGRGSRWVGGWGWGGGRGEGVRARVLACNCSRPSFLHTHTPPPNTHTHTHTHPFPPPNTHALPCRPRRLPSTAGAPPPPNQHTRPPLQAEKAAKHCWGATSPQPTHTPSPAGREGCQGLLGRHQEHHQADLGRGEGWGCCCCCCCLLQLPLPPAAAAAATAAACRCCYRCRLPLLLTAASHPTHSPPTPTHPTRRPPTRRGWAGCARAPRRGGRTMTWLPTRGAAGRGPRAPPSRAGTSSKSRCAPPPPCCAGRGGGARPRLASLPIRHPLPHPPAPTHPSPTPPHPTPLNRRARRGTRPPAARAGGPLSLIA